MPVKFQSRHYQAIAEVMKRSKPSAQSYFGPCGVQWDITVSELGAMFECDNDNFRAEQFYQACGVPGVTWKATRGKRGEPRPMMVDDWRVRGLRGGQVR